MKIKYLFTMMALVVATNEISAQAPVGTVFTDAELNFKIIAATVPDLEVEVSENSSFSGTTLSIPSYATHNGLNYTVTAIGKNAFKDCQNISTVNMPVTISNIGMYAFANCDNLTTVNFSNSLKEIQANAFMWCDKLSFVYLPNSVKTIGSAVFSGCGKLYQIQLPSTMKEIGQMAFFRCSSLTSFTIPDSVTVIEAGTFDSCSSLSEIFIHNRVNKIGGGAFRKCSGLQSIDLGGGIERILDEAFEQCTGLTTIDLGNKLKELGSGVFSGCTNLQSISIPDQITSFGYGLFLGCEGLHTITYSDSLKSIGLMAFLGSGITHAIKIPASVTQIYPMAFSNMPQVPGFKVDPQNQFYESIDSVLFKKGGKVLMQYPWGKSDIAYAIPFGTHTVADFAFDAGGMDVHLQSVSFPVSLKEIRARDFGSILSLIEIQVNAANPVMSSVDGVLFDKSGKLLKQYPPGRKGNYAIPDSVETIGIDAFNGYPGTAVFSLPPSINNIRSYAFADAVNLKAIVSRIAAPASVTYGEDIFDGIPAGEEDEHCSLYVPAALVETYKTVEPWSIFAPHIYPIPQLTVNPTELNIGQAGGEMSFDIAADTDWTASVDVAWLSLSISSGSGNAAVTASADENSATADRAATITVRTKNDVVVCTISVTQHGTITSAETAVLQDTAGGFVRIFDIQGRCIMTVPDMTLSVLSRLPRGIYFVRTNRDVRKIVKL